jgi:hypothetical protein
MTSAPPPSDPSKGEPPLLNDQAPNKAPLSSCQAFPIAGSGRPYADVGQ